MIIEVNDFLLSRFASHELIPCAGEHTDIFASAGDICSRKNVAWKVVREA